mmetsp:Transcript_5078/g.12755  ORF Transcript_5078/g.12755 Transcript_5078/m.12755 type:complete len:100 (+) Transcript_5078:505-804(+)
MTCPKEEEEDLSLGAGATARIITLGECVGVGLIIGLADGSLIGIIVRPTGSIAELEGDNDGRKMGPWVGRFEEDDVRLSEGDIAPVDDNGLIVGYLLGL